MPAVAAPSVAYSFLWSNPIHNRRHVYALSEARATLNGIPFPVEGSLILQGATKKVWVLHRGAWQIWLKHQ